MRIRGKKMKALLEFDLIYIFSAAAAVVCWEFSRTKPGNVIFESTLVPWITSTWSMSLATTIICSGI